MSKFQHHGRLKKMHPYAELWEVKEHEYNTVNKHVIWTSLDEGNEIWAHKQCKGKFFKDNYLSKQTSLPINEESVNNVIDEEIESSNSNVTNNPNIIQSTRKKYISAKINLSVNSFSGNYLFTTTQKDYN